ncbi:MULTISPECIES: arylsulfatase [unclassified Methanoculleus]|uniref:arylsulfatase n=1 Tax=unclassified Methanoculleus TaxID=2619537 RepID=UPI0025CC1F43|nr:MULTISPECIES: arylsulfatase [unclassified Methanoculleus]MCK9319293.1 arylsulfatase [Methanoculleus sp.]MDD2255078.1 arylsulfatase [Methanoculleus sp.]MDD2788082.1 arylsulfatase [Methanoculleus sp.]MDD3217460.1 arylsulfatase [Methanoculleus sp.]MDD4315428.1 arylsulfatase [Methanoculleus sp.]
MSKSWKGTVNLDIRDSVPDWDPYLQPQAPADAPNILMIVWDDVGYGAMDVFGGPIETPTMQRIADMGIRYSNFHTTALCSPTRSSLLTGRNATSNNMACITEASAGFPGISARIPFENGFISEVLNERGYNTYAIGKWHLTPGEETDMSSWKGRWPIGRGFERYYGFLGGETNQWYPDIIYDNHPIDQPYRPDEGYHFSRDIADRAIEFVRDSKMIAPEKPWFMYFCPGCAHAPHHVFKEWADKYRGRFDMGYEKIREQILLNQKKMGLLPENTELSSINPHGEPATTGPDGQPWPPLDFVPPWDSLSEDEKRLFTRMAEVYAGFVTYTDAQIGRILDYLEESGQLENTIIVVVSDNGSSAEGGPSGSFNENKFLNNIPDTVEANLPHIDELGGPGAYNHYCTGWAWAFDTPFPYWKRFAGYEGGTADMCLVAWPLGISARGEIRHQYVHAVDIVPTLYDLLEIEPPKVLKGYTQSPIEGESFRASFDDPGAPGRETQFYAMLGQRAIYHRGWLANTVHPPLSGWGNYAHDVWELYNLKEDRAQMRNLADEKNDVLELLKGLWFYYAGIYQGMPLDDRNPLEIYLTPRPQPASPRTRYIYYPGAAEVPETVAANIRGRSYGVVAGAVIDGPEAQGVLFAHGGVGGGHSLYIADGRLHYVYNWLGDAIQKISSSSTVPAGRHVFTAEFIRDDVDPDTRSAVGTLALYIDMEKVGEGRIRTQPGSFSLTGDGLCVARDSGSPVSPDYTAPFAFTGGTIDRVVIDVSGECYVDHEKEVAAWIMRD